MANNLRVFNLINDYNNADLITPSVSFVVENGKVYYDDAPTFKGKWLATYENAHTESAECDSSSTIIENEINKSSLASVEIGDCVTSIGEKAFNLCGSLTSINIPSGVTSIGGVAFNGCISLTSIEIPDNVTSIGNAVFGLCRSLTSINIPSGVTSIGESVFQQCSGLTSINIPSGVTSIGNSAFYRCSSLTSIDIPSGVTIIGGYAFYQCSSLTSITCNATVPPTLGDNVFSNTNDCPIYVPSASVDAYKSATNWSLYDDRIFPIP